MKFAPVLPTVSAALLRRVVRPELLARMLLPLVAAFLPVSLSAEPIVVHDGRVFLPVVIGGQEVEALLDSGAETTVMDSALAERLGLPLAGDAEIKGSGGSAKVRFAEGVSINIADVTLDNLEVAVLDLSDLSRRLNSGRPINLIVGREFFDHGRWTIDFAQGTLEAADPAVEPPGVKLPLTEAHGIETIPVSVEGKYAVQAAFDIGNGTKVLVGRLFADQAGLLKDGRPLGVETGGGIGGANGRTTLSLSSIGLADRSFEAVPAAIDEHDNADDLNIGTSILSHFRITTDFEGRAIWLEPQD